jgi:hypothetical protein
MKPMACGVNKAIFIGICSAFTEWAYGVNVLTRLSFLLKVEGATARGTRSIASAEWSRFKF